MPPAVDVMQVLRRSRWLNPEEKQVASGCAGKAAYMTRHQADRIANRMTARRGKGKWDNGHVAPKADVYRCPHCNQWHLGSIPEAETRRAEAARRSGR